MKELTLIYYRTYARIAKIMRELGAPASVLPKAVACATDYGDNYLRFNAEAAAGRQLSEFELEYVRGRLRRWLPRPRSDARTMRWQDTFQRRCFSVGDYGGLPRMICDEYGNPWVLNTNLLYYVETN